MKIYILKVELSDICEGHFDGYKTLKISTNKKVCENYSTEWENLTNKSKTPWLGYGGCTLDENNFCHYRFKIETLEVDED